MSKFKINLKYIQNQYNCMQNIIYEQWKRFREYKDTHKGSRCVQKVREGDEQERTPKRCLVLLEMCGKATSRKCAKGRRARRNTCKGCLFMLNGCEKATSTTRYPRWVSCCAQITREGNEHDRTLMMDVLWCSNVGVGVGNGVWAWTVYSERSANLNSAVPVCLWCRSLGHHYFCLVAVQRQNRSAEFFEV
jgi:hypothetical protein